MSNFIRFSEATTLTIHAMIVISVENKNMSTARIAKEIDASYNHLSKVLQRLIKLGYLHSTRGPLGGFTLAKSAKNITFLELYEIHDGKVEEKVCPACFKKCVLLKDGCILGSTIIDFSKSLKEKLKNMTLNDAVVLFKQNKLNIRSKTLSI